MARPHLFTRYVPQKLATHRSMATFSLRFQLELERLLSYEAAVRSYGLSGWFRPKADTQSLVANALVANVYFTAYESRADYGSLDNLVAVSQSGLCALVGSPMLMSAPSGGLGGGAGQASRSALVCLTTM